MQTLKVLETTEADSISVAHCFRGVSGIRSTLAVLNAELSTPTVAHLDNLGIIGWITAVKGLHKFKHILFSTNMYEKQLGKILSKLITLHLQKIRSKS